MIKGLSGDNHGQHYFSNMVGAQRVWVFCYSRPPPRVPQLKCSSSVPFPHASVDMMLPNSQLAKRQLYFPHPGTCTYFRETPDPGTCTYLSRVGLNFFGHFGSPVSLGRYVSPKLQLEDV